MTLLPAMLTKLRLKWISVMIKVDGVLFRFDILLAEGILYYNVNLKAI